MQGVGVRAAAAILAGAAWSLPAAGAARGAPGRMWDHGAGAPRARRIAHVTPVFAAHRAARPGDAGRRLLPVGATELRRLRGPAGGRRVPHETRQYAGAAADAGPPAAAYLPHPQQ